MESSPRAQKQKLDNDSDAFTISVHSATAHDAVKVPLDRNSLIKARPSAALQRGMSAMMNFASDAASGKGRWR